MTEITNDVWFHSLAEVVREIVDNSDGAIAITRERLKQEIILMDPTFNDCPKSVFDHLTLPLATVGLTSSNCDSISDTVLLIHDMTLPKQVARARCREFGREVVFSNLPAVAM